jgi:hypothetical protein
VIFANGSLLHSFPARLSPVLRFRHGSGLGSVVAGLSRALLDASLCCDSRAESGKGTFQWAVRVERWCL